MKTILSITMLCALCCFAQAQEVTKASAELESKSNSKVTGTVTFTKVGDDVQVVADIQNLTPGKHGFHITRKAIARRRMRCRRARISIRRINTTTGRLGRSGTRAISAILKLMLPARGTSSGKANSI